MPKQIRFFFLLALIIGTVQAETPASGDSKGPRVDSIILLDPASTATDRSAQLALLQAAADKREAWAMYQLGTLYRLGDGHPANVLPRDLDKARVYLSNAAILGAVPPLAGMAELELEANRPLDALTWTYIYLYYSRGEGAPKQKTTPYQRIWQGDGYDADLLSRVLASAEDAGVDRKSAGGYAEAFIAKYDQIIRAALAKLQQEAKQAARIELATNTVAMVSPNRQARVAEVATSTTATFLLLFGGDGKPEKIVVEDILPGKRNATIEPLLNIARRARIKPLPPGSEPELARMPVSIIADNKRLK